MDDIAKYNSDRWNAMARAQAIFTRPWLDLTPDNAQQRFDPELRLGELAGKDVLCLAGGGGQQSAALALLGATVTVVDLSEAQLERSREAAAHYGHPVTTLQGDMRDLSRLGAAAFDVVLHPHSLNFVPDARVVFAQVARVLRPGGLYHFNCANPCFSGVQAGDWDGRGYPLREPYVQGYEATYADEPWVFRGELPSETIHARKEFRHTLSTLINGLIDQGFSIRHVAEQTIGEPDATAAPGTDEHFSAIAPPWLAFWSTRI
jgi:2-polyprenyl-3-methyl-5-hydroxy-6-metoxy-1,4-benzoquinol methylase